MAVVQQKIFPLETVAEFLRQVPQSRSHGIRAPSRVKEALPGPEPAKRAGGQQAIDEAVEGFLEDQAPGLALPDAVDQGSQTISEERRSAGDAKHGQLLRAGRNRASAEIGNEEADEQAVREPHPEKLRHGGRGAGING